VQATGATPDRSTGLLEISNDGFKKLKSLFFNIGGERHELTPNAQIWPRALNTAIGGKAGSIYLVVADVRNIPFTLETTKS
jgi:saccharopepsin